MKIAIISDTHGRHTEIEMPEADLVIHCGDFSYSKSSAIDFLEWFSHLNYDNKILIAGNHDEWFEKTGKEAIKELCSRYDERITYLEDEGICIDNIKFYGTPWVPTFYDWAFMGHEDTLAKWFKKIPEDTEVLITHGPQYGVLDFVVSGGFVGSVSLKNKIKELPNLVLHTFGHIHGSSGEEVGEFISINAANSFEYYEDASKIKPARLIEI